MELILTETEREIAAAADRLCATEGGGARLRARRDAGADGAAWTAMVDAGWTALIDPPGGEGTLGLRPLALAAAAAGRHLCISPLVPVLAAAAMLDCAADAQAQALRARIDDGAAILPVLDGRFAMGTAGGIAGAAAAVPGGAGAQAFLLALDADGLAAVEASGAGVSVQAAASFDAEDLIALALDGRQGLGAPLIPAPAARARGLAVATLGTAAEMLGVVDAAFATTLDHLRTRRQFGRAIGSFQALQHRAADHSVAIEICRALIFAAAAVPVDAPELPAAAAASFARMADTAVRVAQDCVQMHGAIGFTDEHDIGLRLKRALSLSSRWGGPRAARTRYAALTGLVPADLAAGAR